MPNAAPKRPPRGNSAAPWTQRAGETDRAYSVFRSWIKRGRGRILDDARSLAGHKTLRTVEHWSAKHDWIERARLYDAEQDRAADKAAVAERARIARRRVREQVRLRDKFLTAVAGDEHDQKRPDAAKGLLGIATDTSEKGAARVRAWLALLEYAGIEPGPDTVDGAVDREAVAAALGCIMARLDAVDAAAFRGLVAKAFAADGGCRE